MSNCLLIILVIGLCVIFGGFPSKFSKCCFHSFILSCWFAAFSFALAVFFLLLTEMIVALGFPLNVAAIILGCIFSGAHWRNFHIRRLVYFFPSFLVVFRICFLILIRIYLLYLCCSIGLIGPISNPTPPTEFFHADTVASDQPLPVSWYLMLRTNIFGVRVSVFLYAYYVYLMFFGRCD